MSNLPIIISAQELHQAIQDNVDTLFILDVREQADYLKSHIPEAHWFNKQVVNRSDNKTVGLLPNINDLYQALSNSGYNSKQHIVVYNDNCNPAAGRVAWTLYAFGLHNISLLNGGFHYWQQSGLATNAETPDTSHTEFNTEILSTPSKDIACDYQDIINTIEAGNTTFIDARTAEEFAGTDIRSTYGGHIPGAVNINWTDTKTDDGLLFKSDDELHELFGKHGITKSHHIITYCQSHQRSALLAMLLIHLGYTHTTGYPGAWSDWGNREDTPKET